MKVYSVLNLADLKIGLGDLFTKRHAALALTKVGAGMEEILAYQRQAIDSLPQALTSGRPLTEELSATDARHDAFGSAIWFLTESYLRAPGVAQNVKDAASRIRAAFIPELGALRDSYADEADAAAKRKDEPTKLEADLKLIPIAGGGTLFDWATSFLVAGEQLSVLLSQRADIDAKTRKEAASLRSETVGILNDLRTAVAREQRRKPDLPKDLDAQIFAYFDTLEEQREAANRAAKATKGKAPEGPTEAAKPEAGEGNPG